MQNITCQTGIKSGKIYYLYLFIYVFYKVAVKLHFSKIQTIFNILLTRSNTTSVNLCYDVCLLLIFIKKNNVGVQNCEISDIVTATSATKLAKLLSKET